MTEKIVLPEKVVLRLVDRQGDAIQLRNVLFMVHVVATRKNNFVLGPFASDEHGVVTISRNDLEDEVAAHYDSGLMDYDRIENCLPVVRVMMMSSQEIQMALESRTKVWTELLGGEPRRWGSIDAIRTTYRTATNSSISVEPLTAGWDGTSSEYEYALVATLR